MTELERCKPMLLPALDRCGGTHEWADVVLGVHTTAMQLWANERAAAITEIVKYPRKTVLNVFLAGGELGQAMEMLESAKVWGVAQGCDAISMSGRRGWLKPLGAEGWKEAFTTMSCELRECG